MTQEEVIKVLNESVPHTSFKACESSNIVAYGYTKQTQELWIAFKGEKVYKYTGISKQQYIELDKAESKGKWVNANLVKTKAKCEAYVIS